MRFCKLYEHIRLTCLSEPGFTFIQDCKSHRRNWRLQARYRLCSRLRPVDALQVVTDPRKFGNLHPVRSLSAPFFKEHPGHALPASLTGNPMPLSDPRCPNPAQAKLALATYAVPWLFQCSLISSAERRECHTHTGQRRLLDTTLGVILRASSIGICMPFSDRR